MIEVSEADRATADAIVAVQFDNSHAGYHADIAAIVAEARQQAEDAMKERCAVIADQHRAGRLLAKDDAAKRKARSEARDHESMAIEAMHIATAIRSTDAGGEGK